MANVVFFSHSYRPDDAELVRFFGDLIRASGLIPSLDPPSDSLNAAKLRRHLRSTDGMVCLMTRRGDSVSPYIMHELRACLAARKPLLVFVEDTIRWDVAPPRILQRRFSRRHYLRQWREHKHALSLLKSYIGEEPPPPYQPFVGPRHCIVLGELSGLPAQHEATMDAISSCSYEPVRLAGQVQPGLMQSPVFYDNIASASLAVALEDILTDREAFLLGAIESAFVPTIELTADSEYAWQADIPREYQAVHITSHDVLADALRHEVEVFEQDLLDITDKDSVDAYYHALLEVETPGKYNRITRGLVVEAVQVGDQYHIHGQAGAVGPGAEARDNVFQQIWQASTLSDENLATLANELGRLRKALKERASQPEEEIHAAEVGLAERAAREGKGSEALRHLRNAGRWALEVARDIGVGVAQAALKAALGLP